MGVHLTLFDSDRYITFFVLARTMNAIRERALPHCLWRRYIRSKKRAASMQLEIARLSAELNTTADAIDANKLRESVGAELEGLLSDDKEFHRSAGRKFML